MVLNLAVRLSRFRQLCIRIQNFRLRSLALPGQLLLVALTPCPNGKEPQRMTLRPILLPNLPSVVSLLPAVFTLCLFLSHLFSLFFQKRKSSSSVQLMVSVCRLPNAGKCWASAPCSLAPAGCMGTQGGERVLRACLVRVPCVTTCVLCVCVVCVFLLTPPTPRPRPAGKQQT